MCAPVTFNADIVQFTQRITCFLQRVPRISLRAAQFELHASAINHQEVLRCQERQVQWHPRLGAWDQRDKNEWQFFTVNKHQRHAPQRQANWAFVGQAKWQRQDGEGRRQDRVAPQGREASGTEEPPRARCCRTWWCNRQAIL